MEKNLEVKLYIKDDGCVEVDLYEPETGDFEYYEFPFSPDEHSEFDQTIGNSLYWWVEQMVEQMMEDREE